MEPLFRTSTGPSLRIRSEVVRVDAYRLLMRLLAAPSLVETTAAGAAHRKVRTAKLPTMSLLLSFTGNRIGSMSHGRSLAMRFVMSFSVRQFIPKLRKRRVLKWMAQKEEAIATPR
jgi:hypothetical protein